MSLNKLKRTKIWCRKKPLWLDMIKPGTLDKTRYARCPDCNKKFELSYINCEEPFDECWHSVLPAHKKLIKVIDNQIISQKKKEHNVKSKPHGFNKR